MLEVKDLRKKYNENLVLKGIDFTIEKGDKIAVIGPSGCGKTTLLRCLNMIENPTSGKIIFNNTNIMGKNIDLTEIRKKIGMVFQQFNLFPHLTVEKNIILAPTKLGLLTEKEAIKKSNKLLKSIGLLDKKDNYPDELSGGQKQRVAIARTLIMNPDIILFDEPTSALDPEMVEEVLELIQNIAAKGMTMVIVSHEMSFVKKIANKILFLENGKISYFGKIEDIPADNKRLEEFLEKNKE